MNESKSLSRLWRQVPRPLWIGLAVFFVLLASGSFHAKARYVWSATSPFVVSDLGPEIPPLEPMPKMPPPSPYRSGTVIPDVVHYVFILGADPVATGGQPAKLAYYAYLFMRSAILNLKPSKIYFHYDYLPTGPWWDEILPHLTLWHHQVPDAVYGKPFRHNAHKSDLLRLLAMRDTGGIYLDSDLAVIRPFDDIMNAPMTMAQEMEGNRPVVNGLCNAMIISKPHAPFLDRWMESYESFDGHEPGTATWAYHSVQMPWRIARAHPDEIQILNGTAAFWPLYMPERIKDVHEKDNYDFVASGQYAYHAWGQLASQYLSALDVDSIMGVDTSFHRLVRPFIGPNDREIFRKIAESAPPPDVAS